jgi:hypothetical protein
LTTDLAELLRYDGWWHDGNLRREFMIQWLRAPRQHHEEEPGPAPGGYRPCPAPSVGRHVLMAGHMFTDDERCWIPDDR